LIKTKSIYDKKEEIDGKRILITRFYPRGIRKESFDRWYRDLSPSVSLLKNLKDGKIIRSIFFQFFCSDLRKNGKAMEICKKLAVESQDKNITLLCYGKKKYFAIDITSNKSVNTN
jgi:uncharacterized protein YeaO (DUF488 family)